MVFLLSCADVRQQLKLLGLWKLSLLKLSLLKLSLWKLSPWKLSLVKAMFRIVVL